MSTACERRHSTTRRATTRYFPFMTRKADPPGGTAFCQLLRRVRDERGLTQSQLGELAGITGSLVSYYEKGRRVPTAAAIPALAEALAVHADVLYEAAGLTATVAERRFLNAVSGLQLPEPKKTFLRRTYRMLAELP